MARRRNQSCRAEGCGQDTGSPWRGYCPEHADQGRENQRAGAREWMTARHAEAKHAGTSPAVGRPRKEN